MLLDYDIKERGKNVFFTLYLDTIFNSKIDNKVRVSISNIFAKAF